MLILFSYVNRESLARAVKNAKVLHAHIFFALSASLREPFQSLQRLQQLIILRRRRGGDHPQGQL
jgi:hypothetical protein